jgi:hypothetical protein
MHCSAQIVDILVVNLQRYKFMCLVKNTKNARNIAIKGINKFILLYCSPFLKITETEPRFFCSKKTGTGTEIKFLEPHSPTTKLLSLFYSVVARHCGAVRHPTTWHCAYCRESAQLLNVSPGGTPPSQLESYAIPNQCCGYSQGLQ